MNLNNLSNDQIVAIGQILAAIFTLLGVLVSMYMSLKALKETREDRKLTIAPYLAFATGGHAYSLRFNKYKNEEKDAEIIQLYTDDDGRIKELYGDLNNYGLGPAIHAKITWIPESIWFGDEEFLITKEKLLDKKYSNEENTIPSKPSHIAPREAGRFFRIPYFITHDYDKKITRVDGFVHITCFDILKNKYETQQKFHIFTDYKAEEPNIHFTFSDIVKSS